MPTGNSTQLEHASVTYAKNEKDISSRRLSKMVLCVVHVTMSFSQNERVFIVRVYYETRSYKSVCKQFTQKFVGREPSTKSSICRLMRKFESTGNVGECWVSAHTDSHNTCTIRESGYCVRRNALSVTAAWNTTVGYFVR